MNNTIEESDMNGSEKYGTLHPYRKPNERGKHMNGKFLWAAALLPLLAACGGERRAEAPLRCVTVTRPLPAGQGETRVYSGIVREAHEIGLGFKTAGQIERVHVAEGDFVRQGQLLAELDDSDYLLALEAAQIQYDRMHDEVERMTQLYREKSLSPNDYEKATAGLRQLGIQLQNERNRVEYTKLHSPIDGYVQHVSFSTAEMVDAGTPFCTLLDTTRPEVEIDIPASLYVERHRIESYACTTPYTGDKTMPLRLLNIVPRADANQLYRMRLAFEEGPDERITAGMNANVTLRLAAAGTGEGFTLPLRTLFRHDGKSAVWVVRPDSTVECRPVTAENTDAEGRAVVRSGLAGDEQVVTGGVSALHEGDRVRIIGTPSRTNAGGIL